MVSSLTQSFVGPAIFTGRWGCHGQDGRAILVGHPGGRALIQEDPSLAFLVGVPPVGCCSLVYAAPASPVTIQISNGGVVVT
jgi:hypothetical protein